MKVAFLASEAAPFCKTGGLGDVAQALPEALSKLPKVEVSVFLPYYSRVKYSGQWKVEFLGYFDVHQRLVAVMDFIDHYPDAQSGFIGFFMREKDLQGTGVGSSIITELCACLAQWDYQYIRLGYVDGNEQSRSFWLKNQFTDTGLRDHTNDYTVVVMNRFLTKV